MIQGNDISKKHGSGNSVDENELKGFHELPNFLKFGVKSWARKMRLWGNKKGKSIGLDSPF